MNLFYNIEGNEHHIVYLLVTKEKKRGFPKVQRTHGKPLPLFKKMLPFCYYSVIFRVDKSLETPFLLGFRGYDYIMPPIPPMPPISGIPPPAFSSGLSATTASVVKNIAATDAAF
ncbi:hypothetical protein ABIA50_003609 [Bacillus subtilis]